MLAAPRNLRVVLGPKAQPWILWDGPCYRTRVERRVEGDDSGWKSLGVVEGTAYSDRDATIGKVNVYRISSVTMEGESEPCPAVPIIVTPCQERTPEFMEVAQSAIRVSPDRINRVRQRIVDVD
jgi:hypothetical protein